MNVITLILIVIRAGSKAGVYGLGFIELGLLKAFPLKMGGSGGKEYVRNGKS